MWFRRSWLGVGVAALTTMVSACTTDYLALDKVTDEEIEKISFPAPTPEIDSIRARYIVAGIALYGVHSVEKYSGEHRTDDALMIVNRLKETIRLQDKFNPSPPKGNTNFHRINRRIETLRLVDAAIKPTRRYYKDKFFDIIVSRDPVSAAKTAFEALKGLAEIDLYKQALLIDARLHVIDLVARVN